MILAIAAAFIAGSIGTATLASAEKGGVGDNLIADAIDRLAAVMQNKATQGPQGVQGPAGGFLTTYANNGPSTNVPANNFATPENLIH